VAARLAHIDISARKIQTVKGAVAVRTCLKSSNKDGNESKRKNLGRDKGFALTIFPESAEFVEPAE